MKELYQFQKVAVEFIKNAPGAMLSDSCGLGKTISAIEAVKACRSEKFKALVVCPPSLVAQWVASIIDQDPNVFVSSTNYVPYNFRELNGWVVTSYFELEYKTLMGQLTDVVWDFIIADEAHRIRNRTTKAANNIKKLIYAKAIALTATPMEHGAQELWSILDFIHPGFFLPYWAFIMEHFVVEEGLYTKWDIKGLKDPTAFGKMISPLMMQRTKEEVMPELPEKILIPTSVVPTKEQLEVYRKIADSKDIIVKVEDEELLIQNVLTLITRLQQVSTMPGLLGLTAKSGKMQWLDEFISDHPNEPVVMFTRFKDVAGFVATKYGGAYVGGDRNEAFLFKNGKVNYAACVIADSLQGVDGLQRANHAIFLDSHWSATQMTQAIDRIHRMDIKEPKNIYQLHSFHVDSLVLRALDEKWTEQLLVYHFIQQG